MVRPLLKKSERCVEGGVPAAELRHIRAGLGVRPCDNDKPQG